MRTKKLWVPWVVSILLWVGLVLVFQMATVTAMNTPTADRSPDTSGLSLFDPVKVTTPTFTPTPTSTPTFTPTPTSTPTFTPTPTPTTTPVVVAIQSAASATGYVMSLELLKNHFGSSAMWAGEIPQGAGRGKWYATVQFDLSDIPPQADIISAEVELRGAPARYQFLSPGAGGRWQLRLLGSGVDLGWLGLSYYDIAVLAEVEETIGPTVSYADFGEGVVNTFPFSEAQLGALEERLGTTGKASFRVDYTATVRGLFRDLYAWDAAAPPILRITYRVP